MASDAAVERIMQALMDGAGIPADASFQGEWSDKDGNRLSGYVGSPRGIYGDYAEWVIDALSDLLREDSAAGEALRARLGFERSVWNGPNSAFAAATLVDEWPRYFEAKP